MPKQYPNVGSSSLRKNWTANPKGAPSCDVTGCTCRAAYRIEVQVNWFRGDDEVGNACEAHKKDAVALAVGIPRARQAAREAQARAMAAKLEKKGGAA